VFLPFGTDRPLRRPTLVTYVLIGLNTVIGAVLFSMGNVAGDDAERVVRAGWLWADRFSVLSLVSYAFLHGSWMHLLGNMLALWVFGPNVEDRFGRLGFLLFYIAGGAAAGAAHCATSPMPVIGASGAIAAVTGAYLVLFPRTHIKTLVIFFFIGIFSIPALWFIALSIAKDLFWFAANSNIVGPGGERYADAVARTAHLGGYAFGALVSFILLWSGRLKREPYDLFSIGRQAMRRRQLRELSARGPTGPIGPQALEVSGRLRTPDRGADPRAEALAKARSAVVTELAAGRREAAIAAYRELLRTFGDVDGAGTLPRRPMSDLANALFLARDHATAAAAYETLLATYPKDPDSPRVRLMLGLINARYLNDPVRAKAVLTGLEADLRVDDERRQARELLAELG
jgi:membrane associated rhomboid family serine protease